MIKRTLLFTVVAVAVAAPIAPRLAQMDPEIWHVDPTDTPRTGRPNDYLVAEGGDQPAFTSPLSPAKLAAALDFVAMSDDRVERLAGDPAQGWVTYTQRSLLMGYPDAISVKAEPDGDGARLSLYSRSRFGYSDMGANQARLERWLAALEAESAEG